MSDMTSSSTSYSTGDGSYYDPIYETTSYATETTTYEATTYETTPTYSYESTSFTPSFDSSATYTETGSYSYDSTDWSAVSEVSGDYHDSYLAQTDMANTYWDMSVDASIAGDSYLAYELNQMSLEYQSGASEDWSTSNQVWSDMDTTTTVTSYDVSSASTYDSSYDTSYDSSSDAGY